MRLRLGNVSTRTPLRSLGLVLGIGFGGCQVEGEARNLAEAAAHLNLPPLATALDSTNVPERCLAANAIVRLRHEDARPLYAELLTVSDCGWKVPTEAAFRLAEIGFRGELPRVRQLLESPDVRHKVSAALVLADAGDTQSLPVLTSLVGTLSNEQGEAWLAWAICRLSRQSGCVKPKSAALPEDKPESK